MASPLPPSRISHRAEGGPDLNYLYAHDRDDRDDDDDDDGDEKSDAAADHRRPVRRGRASDQRVLRGTTLYLGGEEGPNGKIYCVPGHAPRVLCIDTGAFLWTRASPAEVVGAPLNTAIK